MTNWKQCPWCEIKKNGYSALSIHQKGTHPVEDQRQILEVGIKHRQDYLQGAEEHLRQWHEYHQALTLDLPLEVRKLISRALAGYPFAVRRELPIEEELVWAVKYAQENLTEAEQSLAEFEATQKGATT